MGGKGKQKHPEMGKKKKSQERKGSSDGRKKGGDNKNAATGQLIKATICPQGEKKREKNRRPSISNHIRNKRQELRGGIGKSAWKIINRWQRTKESAGGKMFWEQRKRKKRVKGEKNHRTVMNTLDSQNDGVGPVN